MPLLKISKYKPNLNDSRVLARIERVIAYCAPMIEHDIIREIYWNELRTIIGNRHTSKLAEWLYANLFVQEFGYTRGRYPHPWSYRVRRRGYAKIVKLLAVFKDEPKL